MKDNLLIGQYVEANSILHSLDPRTKMISTFVLMLGLWSVDSLEVCSMAALFVLAMSKIAGISVLKMARGLKPLTLVLAFTFLYHAMATDGTVLVAWHAIRITMEGLSSGARYVLRIVLLILLGSMLTHTTKPLTLALGLEKLMSPLSKLHVPVEQFSLMIVIAIRFVPTIQEEMERMLLAQKARGYDISRMSLLKRAFAYVPLLIPLIYNVVQRADQLSLAIDARVYGNGKGRTSYKQLSFQGKDAVAGGFTAMITILLFWF